MSEIQKSNINRDVSHIEKRIISGMEFMSIQDEEYREYQVPTQLPNGKETWWVYRIDNPKWLFVRPAGTHLVLDDKEIMHYVPPFTALRWFNRPDTTRANF
jgi:hypothetical protein